jgi:hypothetical protein
VQSRFVTGYSLFMYLSTAKKWHDVQCGGLDPVNALMSVCSLIVMYIMTGTVSC